MASDVEPQSGQVVSGSALQPLMRSIENRMYRGDYSAGSVTADGKSVVVAGPLG